MAEGGAPRGVVQKYPCLSASLPGSRGAVEWFSARLRRGGRVLATGDAVRAELVCHKRAFRCSDQVHVCATACVGTDKKVWHGGCARFCQRVGAEMMAGSAIGDVRLWLMRRMR
jgi:hypothetical protein